MPVVKTSRFGEVQYEESDVITFVRAILGFDDLCKYFIISRPESEPFKWLQSIDDPSVCFVIIDPMLVVDDYTVDISPYDIKQLQGSGNKDDYMVYTIVTVPKGKPEQMSINLQGPIIINIKKLKAIQVVVNDTKYDVRYSILANQQTV
ncbi:MAG: flagellar assembly protein FliW [Candidatus Zixiibacteriota bacterium]|nr:MAG: flagellar assembly protein FliW [candidate division Zixibacteria bacterium]